MEEVNKEVANDLDKSIKKLKDNLYWFQGVTLFFAIVYFASVLASVNLFTSIAAALCGISATVTLVLLITKQNTIKILENKKKQLAVN